MTAEDDGPDHGEADPDYPGHAGHFRLLGTDEMVGFGPAQAALLNEAPSFDQTDVAADFWRASYQRADRKRGELQATVHRLKETNAVLRVRLGEWETFEAQVPDYEALGYPETDVWETDVDAMANVARYFTGSIDMLAFEKSAATDNELRDDVDYG